jgi:uncharacterized protein (DUF1778 family)
MNMWAMADRNRGPRLSLQVEQEDREAIAALRAHFPGSTESFIIRAAIRVGLAAIAEDRTKVEAKPPKIPPPKRRGA